MLKLDSKDKTKDKMKEMFLLSLLESLYNKNMIDINVYRNIKAEIERS